MRRLVRGEQSSDNPGARGLLTILEAALRPFNFELPSTPLTSLEVDAATIREPQAALARLLERQEDG